MKWINQPPVSFNQDIAGINPFVLQYLARKGITSKNQIEAFMDPDHYTPSPGNEIPGLELAVERINQALDKDESICVWGDFDADGQTSTSLLVQTLKVLGGNVQYHIPIRATESHGVNIPNLKPIIDNGATCIITCDTGITAHEAVRYAKSRDVDFVITDHHDLPDTLPDAVAVTDPKLLSRGHPLENLSGVGIAYKVAESLLQRRGADFDPDSLLDLVAIGMIADLAGLTRDSRYLVQKGLVQLAKTKSRGLQTMMALSELNSINLNEEHVGYVLAPRLNALGRLGDANPAVELLTTEDPVRAKVLATQLEGLNIQRRLLCDQVIRSAEDQLLNNPSLRNQPVIILSHQKWPGGVVGIAASAIVEKYGKPTIIFSCPAGEPARGSARSIEGFNITEAISRQSDILLGYGGHPMAAGLSLEPEKLSEFQRRIIETANYMAGDLLSEEKSLVIDGWMSLAEIELGFAEELERLSPFGPGNNKPIMAIRDLSIREATEIGKNKEHLKIQVEDESHNSREVLFWDGVNEDLPTGKFDLAFSLRPSNWKGVRQCQMVWQNARQSESKILVTPEIRIELVDYRTMDGQEKLLQSIPIDTQVWAEGPVRKQVNGFTRVQLSKSKNLAIWSIPPSLEDLKHVLELTQPETIFLFSMDPKMDNEKNLLDRLAGLIKYSIAHKSGQTTLEELAAECAQTKNIIKKALEVLIGQGMINIQFTSPDEVLFSYTKDSAGGSKTNVARNELREFLQESSAFRKFYKSADLDSLIS